MAEPSETFICPITHELMTDPVIDPDGNSYERRAIEDWLKQNGTSPITRSPLTQGDLRPNRGLKAAINEYRKSITAAAEAKSVRINAKPINLNVHSYLADDCIHISIEPPKEEARSGCDICCVVDTSGSMAVQAEIQNADNEKFGLSQLDLVKHAMKTIIHSLQPQDRLALVSFANNATVHFQLTKMNDDGKSSALAALQRLEDNGQTNLWDGLRTGIDILLKGQRPVGSNAALFLLTDGCPNLEPPRGHLPTLEKMKKKTNFTCSLNTFGFGYSLDSKLLEDIAIMGNSGSYAFIPDGAFVGTIFVNAITGLLTTAATNVQVLVKGQPVVINDYTRWYSVSTSNEGTLFNLGSVVFGHTKDILIPLSPELQSGFEVVVTYDTALEKQKSVTIQIDRNIPRANQISIAQQKSRLGFINCVRNVFEAKRHLTNNPNTSTEQLEAAVNQMKALEAELKKYAETDEYIKDILTDLTGQVNEAITRDDWFNKWGIHFLPSLTRAHLLQYCNNFKDPGVQHYGRGALFTEVRDDMDSIFCGLPAPKPAVSGAKIDMAVFNYSGGGCFHGKCTVKLMNGTTKFIKDVIPGDCIAPHGGIVNFVVKTKCRNGKTKMVQLDNGLLITSWHPIRVNEQWLMPCSLVSAPIEIVCEEVFNFALDKGHIMMVNGVECVTLGHGFQDDVVRHAYYGTQRVIEDLRRLDAEQNKTGIVEIAEDVLIRSKQTGLVTGLKKMKEQNFHQILVQ